MEAVLLIPAALVLAIIGARAVRWAITPALRRWEGPSGTEGHQPDPEPVERHTAPTVYMRRADWEKWKARLEAERVQGPEERPLEQWPAYDH